MYQIVQAAALDPNDTTEFSLIFANQTDDDILLRTELETLAKDNPRFKLWYTLDRPGDNWKYSKGFVTKEMIKENIPAAGNDTVILLCGPPAMIKFACLPALQELGHDLSKVLEF
eukprot:comp22441_c0_seq2/m.33703 comp22441_c0_seq2/g.33703  ORF comp22441_c0_seq2/g.33703 comp22441_c0_seq2/m.33703 type:complete len:115 (-) comp22441_c0_seq2:557-901(-)